MGQDFLKNGAKIKETFLDFPTFIHKICQLCVLPSLTLINEAIFYFN